MTPHPVTPHPVTPYFQAVRLMKPPPQRPPLRGPAEPAGPRRPGPPAFKPADVADWAENTF